MAKDLALAAFFLLKAFVQFGILLKSWAVTPW